MPQPSFCPNPRCRNHREPQRSWRVGFGRYHTRAHGWVRRYQCRGCGRTCSDQTESPHYYAKRRAPLSAIMASLVGGASQREIARRYHLSVMTVHGAVLRLGRQAMAAQLALLDGCAPREGVVYDGLRSCVSSQDYPCDITTVVESAGEMIMTMRHTIIRRGGAMTDAQRRRVKAKEGVWQPRPGTVRRDITLLCHEIADYLRPGETGPAIIDTDEHPVYRAVIHRSPVTHHLMMAGQLCHIKTSSQAPRTIENRLFPVNYIDRLLRHRLKEHTRQTIAIGRHAVMQMHRAWIFAIDHNVRRERRVRRPQDGVHAQWGGVDEQVIARIRGAFFRRRLRPVVQVVPRTIRDVWLGALQTPPLRWRVGQKGSSVRIPRFAIRDLRMMYQQAG